MYWKILSAVVVLFLTIAAIMVYQARRSAAGWAAWLCYQVSRLHSIIFTHWQAENDCTYPEFGPAIIVANHTSPVDPPTLWIRHFARFGKPRLRVIGFMMAKEYYEYGGLITWTCKSMECIPATRSGHDMVAIREALRRLKDGQLLGLFPEGKLNMVSPDEQLLPASTGVAWLALRTGAPVIPVFIRGAPRSRSMFRAYLTCSRTVVKYGQPVDLSRWQGKKPSHGDLVKATDLIMQRLAELGGLRTSPTEQ